MSRKIDEQEENSVFRKFFREFWKRFCSKSGEENSPKSRFISQAGKEIVSRDSNFGGLLHDPIEENVTSILDANENNISDEDFKDLMRLTSPFHLNVESLVDFIKVMEQHCELGLDETEQNQSDLKMLPTFITNLPTKNEQGNILALDLGGTNFRTLIVKLSPDEEPQVLSQLHIVPDSKKIRARDLFEFIADVLKQFMIQNQLDLDQEFLLGFTFSFACQQTALNQGIFLTPSKGWILADLIGKDVVQMLQMILYEKKLRVKITALINDTVGTLMACGSFVSNNDRLEFNDDDKHFILSLPRTNLSNRRYSR